jgi:hypothetical protein
MDYVGHHAKQFEVAAFGYLDGLIGDIHGHQAYGRLGFQTLDREFTIECCNHNIAVVSLQRAVNDQDIPGLMPASIIESPWARTK